MTKTCKRCRQDKPLDQYSTQRGMKDGLRSNCRPCNSDLYKEYCSRNPEKVRDSYYRKSYGISLEEYREMLEAQGHVCAICGCPESAGRKSLAVDHNPVTGNIRKILCHKCNAGLGHFDDSATRLEQAARYIMDHLLIEVEQ